MKNKKAQSSIEFVLIIAAMLFAFSGFLFVLQQNIGDKTREERSLEVQKVALSVQEEIKLATESSEGYHRVFNVPTQILNMDYTISITENLIYLHTDDGKNSLTLQVPEISGQLVKGANSIKKINGTVLLN